MNQSCCWLSFAHNVRVTRALIPTRISGPGSEIVALERPHPRVAEPTRVALSGLPVGRTWTIPHMEGGWKPQRYVQFPDRSAMKEKVMFFGSPGPLKFGDTGSPGSASELLLKSRNQL